jgi:putative flippase GtrA
VARREAPSLRPADVVAYLRSPEGVKLLRYSAASIVSLVVSVLCLVVFDGVFGWAAVLSSTLATAIATIPSYELNRKWAWGKSGKGHLWREVVPFWVTGFIGWGFSTLCVAGAADWAADHHVSHLVHTGLLAFVYVAAFGVLWIGKFVFFNKVLFAHGDLHDPANGPGLAEASAGIVD